MFNEDEYNNMLNNPRSGIPETFITGEDLEEEPRSQTIFAVSSDVYFLYMIGKMCARSGHNLTEGLQALNDYYLFMWHYSGA